LAAVATTVLVGGVSSGLRSKHRAFWAFVIATIGYVILISTGTAGDAGFRAPLVPLIAPLAAPGIRHSHENRRHVPTPTSTVQHEQPAATAGSPAR
jgi:hypothetical protein